MDGDPPENEVIHLVPGEAAIYGDANADQSIAHLLTEASCGTRERLAPLAPLSYDRLIRDAWGKSSSTHSIDVQLFKDAERGLGQGIPCAPGAATRV